MSLPFHLGLRHRRHMLSLVRSDVGGRMQTVLGVAYPEDMNPRLRILDQWAMEQGSPRRAMQATIDQPLPPRHRVALLAQLNPSIQSAVQSGFDGQPAGRREIVQGVKARVHLGVDRNPIANGQPPMPGGRVQASAGPNRGGRRR